jgi:outer membrane murein-binding lipoprotein Lpp
MNKASTPFNALAVAVILGAIALTGCSRDKQPDTTSRDASGITFTDKNVTLHVAGHPDATITAEGDLLIDGKPIQLDASQHQQVLAYRAQLNDIAQQGIEVGKQGAALGVQAAGDALKSVFNGDTDKIGDKIEAQADKIKEQALKICDHLDKLRAAQDALAAQVPAFKPYASLDTDSAADCRKN